MEQDVFRSRNLQVSAFLIARGAKLLECERTGATRCEFLFRDPTGEVAALADAYYKGETCKALAYYRAQLELRAAIDHTLNGGAR